MNTRRLVTFLSGLKAHNRKSWFETHRAEYEAAGVVFVHHRNAEDSLRQLAKIFPSVKAPQDA